MIPVTTSFVLRGYIAIHTSMQDIYHQRKPACRHLCVVRCNLYPFLLILLFFSSTIYRPLRKITQGAKEYAAGNLTYNIPVNSHDEMGYLASTLNYMSDELNKTQEYQRKFVANVSHDFRSPLTSIKGYVEAIQDGTIPPEMQGKYLDIVLFETERLNKLTKSMLALNNLNSRGRFWILPLLILMQSSRIRRHLLKVPAGTNSLRFSFFWLLRPCTYRLIWEKSNRSCIT